MYIPIVVAIIIATVASLAIFFCLFFLFILFVSKKEESQEREENAAIDLMMAELNQLALAIEELPATTERRDFLQKVRKKLLDLLKTSIQVNSAVRKQDISRYRDDMKGFRAEQAELSN